MSALVATTPLTARPASVGALGWIAAAIDRVRAAAAAVSMNRHEREFVELIRFGASRLGRPLLAVATLDDLEDQLDRLVESADLSQVEALALIPAAALAGQDPDSFANLASALDDVVGHGQRAELERHAALIDAWGRAHARLLSSVMADCGDVDALSKSVAAFSVTDPELPAEVAEAIVAARRAELLQFALVEAGIERITVEPWLARALVERFIASVRTHMRFLAALMPAEVSVELVPAAQRLDLHEIERRHRATREAAARSLRQAQAGEGGGYAGPG